ncbi:D-alanyl-D-alanine carboxypeptidase family protein [Gluconobacter wancherniae]|uniref:Peptidase S11 D-alanyl-D-alanine carboxypeptidase A N-terminal domain-containing protein n=1 Tax=Gluconobacter wancherniae NBRC 103581 TaxID=656744 RepID=A0A511AVX1_9PROT|nr:D-alanyl-D-alanine carboxypeptidase family protein [Gluconobacter wancherniae]MBF0852494.1 D-alanyl-D-alanine carboxypeptidase [Gluconobacter wancherniae]MBS1062167.1 D-alanyl-D-alanine carboxypeptidase [Gluconobacter wancherniae]MBS1087373.1 D-alanyl-D-alanine carboxypeptidase [Gluconobacter wancherniae]GBD56796.1 D-alanyl-D-alanine carboxypeptidase [Gluconobacter wancherniae NBRC 103581]GBR64564.1 D-alanyl-D-alanine serine-type carboxypeptidase [Gluconobacter wancherniae NBRC 103581]
MRFRFRKALLLSAMTATGVGSAHAQYVGHVSSFVMDAHTGAVLAQNDADLQRYPASLTKLMTLYLTFRALQAGQITLDEQVPVSIHTSMQAPSKLGLVPGTKLTVEQAILALVTKSANDAACALGEFLGGGDEVRFAGLMTQQARALGMSNTTFRNASGLPDPDQVTTARDLGVLAQRLIADYPQYYHYFDVPSFYFHRRMIPNHDPMLKIYAGADGLKTGYTDLAGRNLVTSAQRGNVRLIGVVMGSTSNARRSMEMAALLDKGFADEGVAPQPLLHPAAPRVLMASARHGRHFRHGVMIAAARPMEVADAPSGPRRYGRLGHHPVSVRMVTTRHVAVRHKAAHHSRG